MALYGMAVFTLEGGARLVFWAWNESAKMRARRDRELLDRIEARFAQNPDAAPKAGLAEIREELRNGNDSRGE
jgi:enoyl-[acyl-carrier-protein] reductase (NADH)